MLQPLISTAVILPRPNTDNVTERSIDRSLRDDAEVRNKERALLGKVLASRVTKRGGLSKERTSQYPYLQNISRTYHSYHDYY